MATWLFAILKNKIIDEFRRRARQPVTDDSDDEMLAAHINDQFDNTDHWISPVSQWSDPHASLEQKRFWDVFDACISGLPERCARVFGMRELLGMETDDICKELNISTSNCWVLLHRARMGLRECLSQRWFGERKWREVEVQRSFATVIGSAGSAFAVASTDAASLPFDDLQRLQASLGAVRHAAPCWPTI